MLARLRREEKGQALTEYALVLGVIVVGLVAVAMTPLHDGITAKIGSVVSALAGAA
jgi:Flp pilus assembly pilin Flp